MNRLSPLHSILAALAAMSLAAGCDSADSVDESTTTLRGDILDWNDEPVAGAEVVLVIGEDEVSERIATDSDGHYELEVPGHLAVDANLRGKEVNLVVHSPAEDLAPFGTAEGDRVTLTPLTLQEFIADMSLLNLPGTVDVRTGYVPLQAPGYAITRELMERGGELTWNFAESTIGGELEITLIIEPG